MEVHVCTTVAVRVEVYMHLRLNIADYVLIGSRRQTDSADSRLRRDHGLVDIQNFPRFYSYVGTFDRVLPMSSRGVYYSSRGTAKRHRQL